MKKTLLLIFAIALFWESGCALGPTIDEQSRQESQENQNVRQSDAFAKNLQQ